jgi:hypothetical protein
MKHVAFRAMLFALVPFGLALVGDLVLWVFYQGAQPAELRDEIVLLHGALFLALFALSTLGSFVSFLIWRQLAVTSRVAALAGLLFAVATFVVAFPALAYGGPLALGAWLFFGALVFAAGACKWGAANAG